MATVQSVVKIKKASDDSLEHYDVNYEEGFVVVVKAEELTDQNDITEVLSKAAVKATAIEELEPTTVSEAVELP